MAANTLSTPATSAPTSPASLSSICGAWSELLHDAKAAVYIARAIARVRLQSRGGYICSFFTNSLDVVGMAVSFQILAHTFGTLGGWNPAVVAVLVGCAIASFGYSIMLMGGFDTYLFLAFYQSGEFETALLRSGRLIPVIAATLLRPYRLGRSLLQQR